MAHATALKLAIELYHVPSRVRSARTEDLPEGILEVLQIAAGEDGAAQRAAARIERPIEVVRSASAFFIEQIMLSADADCYRVLGGTREASAAELRRNMALLLRWLHPDLDQAGARSMFVGRVVGAWEILKSPERRQAYDDRLNSAQAQEEGARGHRRLRRPRLPPGAGRMGLFDHGADPPDLLGRLLRRLRGD